MLASDEFAPNLIKKYHFWDLFLSPKQRYLGRSYIWWRDRSHKPGEGENMALDHIPDEALLEVKKIWRDAVRISRMLGYKTDPYGEHFKLNTCYLANERWAHNGHMHIHFFPRTAENFFSEPTGLETMDVDFERMYLSGGTDRYLTGEGMANLVRISKLYAIA